MRQTPRNRPGIVSEKLSLIESLIQRKEFKQAVAELRDLENQTGFGRFCDESGEFYYLFALALQGVGNYEEALSKAKESFEILRNSSENEKLAKVQFISGIIYSDLGDLTKSESELRDALAIYRRIKNEKGIIESYNELGRIHFIRTEYSKAIEYLREGLSYCKEMKDDKRIARFSGNLGRIYLRMGKWKEAKENLLLSLESNKLNNNLINICCCYLSLGYLSYLMRDFSQANKYLEKALKLIFENNYTREFAIYSEYSGELEFAQGNYEKAKNHYMNCISRMEEIAPESDMISQTYRLLAELQIAEKQYEEALSSCGKALKVATALGEKIEIGAIHRALGQIYTAKREKEKAKETFEEAISILEQIGAKFELGKTYLEAGKSNCSDFFDRVQYLGRAKDVFKELDSQYHEGLVQLAISKLFFENEEYEKAFLFLRDAEKIFKDLKEEKELSSVLSFSKILEKGSGKFESAIDVKSRYTFSNIITRSQKIQKIIEEAKKVKDSDLTILLEGETGTGKDLLAKTIHYESKRKNKNFVAAQCSAIPETLLENALFGHVKGAYTGANESSVGLFEESAGGTLYLDEIAEIPLSTQVKLLRAIEEREITRIGETKPKKIDVRIISSTSRDLAERVSKDLFREDLYFRLNALSFKLPPLRERKEDIGLLTKYFLKENGLGKDDLKVLEEPEFLEPILRYDWPGNVRELKHEIERLFALAITNEGLNLNLLKERMKKLSDKKGKPSLYDLVAEFEKELISKALKENDWVITRAAEALKLHEASLRTKLKKYGINKPETS
ncbi:MAG: sigma 54-interacting transcriptional regulator [candidate division Zixibacteria bacterium]|nr:sigma 54-interacting transcriptional regulator [candidate division Zixibacteria bacterium]